MLMPLKLENLYQRRLSTFAWRMYMAVINVKQRISIYQLRYSGLSHSLYSTMMMQMTGSNQLLIGERVPHVIKPGLHWDDPHIIVRGDLLKHFTSRKGLYCIFSWNLFWSCVFSLVRFPNCLEASGLGNLTSFSDVFGMIILRFHNLLLFPKASQPPVRASCIPRNAKVAQRTRLRACTDPMVLCFLPEKNHMWPTLSA